MPILKLVLAIISSIAAVFLIVTMTLVVSFKAEMSNDQIKEIFGTTTEPGKLYYQPSGTTSYSIVTIGNLPLSVLNQVINWLSYVIYILPPLYL
jgi:hypothetical protein